MFSYYHYYSSSKAQRPHLHKRITKHYFYHKCDCLLFEGTEEELDCELADGLRDLRRAKGRDLDLDRERRRPSDGRVVPWYGAGE